MFDTRSTRALLAPADPAAGAPESTPRVPAMTLIDRAESTADASLATVRRPAPRRGVRFALAATTAVAAVAAVTVVVVNGTGDAPVRGPQADRPSASAQPAEDSTLVVSPIAYTITTNPPGAAAELRALAKRIRDAPYDARTGRYAYVHSKTWGDPQMSTENGKYTAGATHQDETWQAATRAGVQRTTNLPPEYPDQASRDYFKDKPLPVPGRASMTLEAVGTLPTSRAGLAERLHLSRGPSDMAKAVDTIYSRYPLSRATRSTVLEILADQQGFRWRGAVTDRAGRKGVAITGDQAGGRSVLIFDPVTGALLASENVQLVATPVLSAYSVFLGYDRRDTAPTVPAQSGPPTKPGAPSVS